MKLKHYDSESHAGFITFCTHNRLPLLTNDAYCHIVVNTIDTIRRKFHFKLLGYVIMPEHVHLVIIPASDTTIGNIIGEIKRVSSRGIHNLMEIENPELINRFTVVRNRKKRFAFWQRRCYDHNCRSEKAMWEKINYCHSNPMKRGLVTTLEDYKWSSYNWYHGDKESVLTMDSI